MNVPSGMAHLRRARAGSLSLQWKLPLLVGGLLLGTVVVLYAAAYVRVRQEGTRSVHERLSGVVNQLAGLLEAQAHTMVLAAATKAHTPPVREFVRSPRPASERTAFASLQGEFFSDTSLGAIALRDADGKILAARGRLSAKLPSLLDPRELPRSASDTGLPDASA